MGGKVQGLRSTNWWVQNRQEDVKNSIGNGEAKELSCITRGYKLREALLEGMGGTRWKGAKEEKLGQL